MLPRSGARRRSPGAGLVGGRRLLNAKIFRFGQMRHVRRLQRGSKWGFSPAPPDLQGARPSLKPASCFGGELTTRRKTMNTGSRVRGSEDRLDRSRQDGTSDLRAASCPCLSSVAAGPLPDAAGRADPPAVRGGLRQRLRRSRLLRARPRGGADCRASTGMRRIGSIHGDPQTNRMRFESGLPGGAFVEGVGASDRSSSAAGANGAGHRQTSCAAASTPPSSSNGRRMPRRGGRDFGHTCSRCAQRRFWRRLDEGPPRRARRHQRPFVVRSSTASAAARP